MVGSEQLDMLLSFLRLGYNKDGYNKDGYDKNGYNKDGYDKNGYNKDGYNKVGYNKDGYDKDGYNKVGYHKDGYNKDGYNKNGYDIDGYNKDGYDIDGYDIDGYNKGGYNKDGYDKDGFSKDGYDMYGYDIKGFDKNGAYEGLIIKLREFKNNKNINKDDQIYTYLSELDPYHNISYPLNSELIMPVDSPSIMNYFTLQEVLNNEYFLHITKFDYDKITVEHENGCFLTISTNLASIFKEQVKWGNDIKGLILDDGELNISFRELDADLLLAQLSKLHEQMPSQKINLYKKVNSLIENVLNGCIQPFETIKCLNYIQENYDCFSNAVECANYQAFYINTVLNYLESQLKTEINEKIQVLSSRSTNQLREEHTQLKKFMTCIEVYENINNTNSEIKIQYVIKTLNELSSSGYKPAIILQEMIFLRVRI